MWSTATRIRESVMPLLSIYPLNVTSHSRAPQRLWLGVKPGDSDNYQVRSVPDAGRPLQKSQNGVAADQNHADTQS